MTEYILQMGRDMGKAESKNSSNKGGTTQGQVRSDGILGGASLSYA